MDALVGPSFIKLDAQRFEMTGGYSPTSWSKGSTFRRDYCSRALSCQDIEV